jgi:hypothetical protein
MCARDVIEISIELDPRRLVDNLPLWQIVVHVQEPHFTAKETPEVLALQIQGM